MSINDYSSIFESYASSNNDGTAFLAFKTIPWLISNFAAGKKTLDFGCGAGGSISFLKKLDLTIEGVDISPEMLDEAKKTHPNIKFKLINNSQLPYNDDSFNIVFSSFVLFEIPSKMELINTLNEIYRVLKKEGIFIGITGSMELYSHQWLSLDVNFEQNKSLKSGDIAKVLLKDVDLIVYDYYWTDKDYQEVIDETPFCTLKTLYPLGEKTDGYEWMDEEKYPPYVIYVLLKK